MPRRPLLIPHKRPLLSNKTKNSTNGSIPKVLNPSATAAETRMKPALAASDDDDVASQEDPQPLRFELSFAMPPQPFLDPPAWEAMLKKHKEAQAAARARDEGSSRDEERDADTVDQRRQRQNREAEYGSMAIRGRSGLTGRGRQRKGKETIHWGGR